MGGGQFKGGMYKWVWTYTLRWREVDQVVNLALVAEVEAFRTEENGEEPSKGYRNGGQSNPGIKWIKLSVPIR